MCNKIRKSTCSTGNCSSNSSSCTSGSTKASCPSGNCASIYSNSTSSANKSTDVSGNHVGLNSGNCMIKNVETENTMSSAAQGIIESATQSGGKSLADMASELNKSGFNAVVGKCEEGKSKGKSYIDIKDGDKTYRLWDFNKDLKLSEDDFKKQLLYSSSNIKEACSGGNCSKSGCNGTSDSSGGCNGTSDSSDCNGTGSSGCNGTSGNSGCNGNSSSSSGIVAQVANMLKSIPQFASMSDNDRQNMANAYISLAQSALGNNATDANVLNYVTGMLQGSSTGTTAATGTTSGATSNTGTGLADSTSNTISSQTATSASVDSALSTLGKYMMSSIPA